MAFHDETRQLAYVEKISAIDAIPQADRIELATVRGWRVIVGRGEFMVGDLVVFCEIDSVIPPWKCFKDVCGLVRNNFRVRTMHVRGLYSQGFCFSLNELEHHHPKRSEFVFDSKMITFKDGREPIEIKVGTDLTKFIGVTKYENMESVPMQNGLGKYPSCIPKSFQPRIQNISEADLVAHIYGATFEITEKLDGQSITILRERGATEVTICTHNCSIVAGAADQGVISKTLVRMGIVDALLRCGMEIALQGELIGPGVRPKNVYSLKRHEWRIYDIFLLGESRLATPGERRDIIAKMGLDFDAVHVPVVAFDALLPKGIDEILAMAQNVSALNRIVQREGIVCKSMRDSAWHFKAVSNVYLAKEK